MIQTYEQSSAQEKVLLHLSSVQESVQPGSNRKHYIVLLIFLRQQVTCEVLNLVGGQYTCAALFSIFLDLRRIQEGQNRWVVWGPLRPETIWWKRKDRGITSSAVFRDRVRLKKPPTVGMSCVLTYQFPASFWERLQWDRPLQHWWSWYKVSLRFGRWEGNRPLQRWLSWCRISVGRSPTLPPPPQDCHSNQQPPLLGVSNPERESGF